MGQAGDEAAFLLLDLGDGALEGMDTQKIQVIKARVSDVEADALRIELEEIQAMRDEGAISRETARNLREEVYLLQMTIGD